MTSRSSKAGGSPSSSQGGPAIDVARTSAIIAARAVATATRALALGGGTALPGLVAELMCGRITRTLAREVRCGTVVVTGTNGKTTTASMLAESLRGNGLSVVANDSGSNLARGIAAALVEAARLAHDRPLADVGVFEVDELAMPGVVQDLRPDLVVVTNFLRDQLDRSGELDRTVAHVGEALSGLDGVTVILNGDDPLSAALAAYTSGRVMHYGIDDAAVRSSTEDATSAAHCPSCGEPLRYERRSFGHLGVWDCPACSLRRPTLDVAATHVSLSARSSTYLLDSPGLRVPVTLAAPALYNVYNSLAAAAAARVLLVHPDALRAAFCGFTPVFGRMETLEVAGREVMLLLTKNPVGATQALAAVLAEDPARHIAFVLNDRPADGRDVSWVWDVGLESFDLSACRIVVSGTRAEDMAVRLKYAGAEPGRLEVEPDPVAGVRRLAAGIPAGETAFVFPTYSAMLEIRNGFAAPADPLASLGRLMRRGM